MIPPLTPSPFGSGSNPFSPGNGLDGTAGTSGPNAAQDLDALNGATGSGSASSFTQELQGAIQQMEQLQTNAQQQVGALVNGHSEDVHSAMIAVEKSDLAFGMMLQLRNKAVAAYQDIANMNF